MLTEFGKALIFILLGVIFVIVGLFAAWIIRPHRPYPEKNATYECGEEPVGNAWIRLNVRFYIVALIFLIFDIEIAVLLPWALVYRQFALFGFLEMLIFLVILFVGYAYVWLKGDLSWDKPKPEIPVMKRTIIKAEEVDRIDVFVVDDEMTE